MKKNIIFSVLGLTVSLISLSQAKEHVVKVDPIRIAFGTTTIGYERAFTEKSSGQLNLSFIAVNVGGLSESGFGVAPEYRFYKRAALDNFYFGPTLSCSFINLKDDLLDSEADLTAFGVGAQIGWNWLLGKNNSFMLNLGIGAQYLETSLDITTGDEGDFSFSRSDGLVPMLNFSIGYAF